MQLNRFSMSITYVCTYTPPLHKTPCPSIPFQHFQPFSAALQASHLSIEYMYGGWVHVTVTCVARSREHTCELSCVQYDHNYVST